MRQASPLRNTRFRPRMQRTKRQDGACAHKMTRSRADRNQLVAVRGAGGRVMTASLLVVSLFAPGGFARPSPPQSNNLKIGSPESVGMSGERLSRIDEAVRASIERRETPGAVVLTARKGRIVY